MGRAYGIDLGTSMVKIYKKGKGIVCNQRNMIAIDDNDDLLAVGDDAFEMYEKTPDNVNVMFPIRNGVIADIASMERLFNVLVKNISHKGRLQTAEYVIAVPMDITEVEKKAFIQLIENGKTKARKVRMVAKPIAAAVGAGLDVCWAKGALVIDIGASTTEIAVISLGGIVISKLISVGCDTMVDSIVAIVKKKHNLLIGKKTAYKLMDTLCVESRPDKENYKNEEEDLHVENVVEETHANVYGRNVITGLPEKVSIDKKMVCDAIEESLYNIIDATKIILERTPPEIASDIIETGVYMVGGMASIKGLDALISVHTGLVVKKCDNPEFSVVKGMGKIIENSMLSKMVIKNVK